MTASPSIAHDIARRLLKHLDNGSDSDRADSTMSISGRTYADSGRWEQDRTLLRTTPTVVALSSELRESGSFTTTMLGDQNVIVVRGADGRAYVHLNRCTHRGTELVSGNGHRPRFTCPFHGWSFKHSGELMNVTSEKDFCGLNKSEFGLRSLPVREEAGLIWSVGDPELSLDGVELLHGLDEDIAQLDLERWHFQYAEPMHADLSWRMLLEAGFETYHLPYIHPQTASKVFHSNVITFDAFGPHFRMAFPRRTISELRDLPEAEWDDPVKHLNLMYYLFPNTTLLYNAGIWRALPGSFVGESSLVFNFFTIGDDPTMTDAQRQRFEFAIDVTKEEDNPAAEASYRNLSARPDDDIILGRNEVALQHLHRELDQATIAL